MKINFVIGGHFVPQIVDDYKVKHECALIIEDESQNFRVCLGLDIDENLSKNYMPYWHRTLDLEKLIYLRDNLTKLIDRAKKNETDSI